MGGIGLIQYVKVEPKLNDDLSAKLEQTAKVTAKLLDLEAQSKVIKDYVDKNPGVNASPEFLKFASVLRRIRDSLLPGSEIYVYLTLETEPFTMLFISMDGIRPYAGNSAPLALQAKSALEMGRVGHSKLSRDRDGYWASAYAPVRNLDGKIVAAVAVDYRADEDLQRAREEWLKDLSPYAGTLFLLLFGFGYYGQKMGRRIRYISQVAVAYIQGNFKARRPLKLKDEIGTLFSNISAIGLELEKSQVHDKGYIKNLETALEQTDQKLELAKKGLRAFTEGLRVPVLMFGRDGKCQAAYSQAAIEAFGKSPEGQYIWDLLGASEVEWDTLLESLFASPASFSESTGRCPEWYQHQSGRIYLLDYNLVFAEESTQIASVIVTALDYTGELSAEAEAERERDKSQGVYAAIFRRHQFLSFISRFRRTIGLMQGLTIGDAGDKVYEPALTNEIKQLIGQADYFCLMGFSDPLKQYALELLRFHEASPTHAILVKNSLDSLGEKIATQFEHWLDGIDELSYGFIDEERSYRLNLTSDLLGAVSLISDPATKEKVSNYLFNEPVSRYIKVHEKQVKLMALSNEKSFTAFNFREEEDPRVRGEYFQDLFDALISLFQASIYWTEPGSTREQAGKPKETTITITSAITEPTKDDPSWLSLCIEDDSGGLDSSQLRSSLSLRLSDEELKKLSDHEILQKFFDDSLCKIFWEDVIKTTAPIPHLCAVRNLVKSMGGVIELSSTKGLGSLFVILVPLPYSDSNLQPVKLAA